LRIGNCKLKREPQAAQSPPIQTAMQIRAYEDADQGAVVELWNAVLPDSAPHNEPATSIRNKLAVEHDLFFLAEIDGAIVGTVMGGYDGHRGWVYSVAVDPGFRRRGIATSLIQRLEAALIRRGCLKVNLQVRSTNADVIAFYRTLGFDVEERISMGKRLY
jgi:ribosomal protein S18 acetylase RimI-like enzyme